MDLLIKNTRIVDKNRDIYGDIYIKDGIINDIGINLKYDVEIIDGSSLVTMPAFTELHAHLREPGYEYKEDIESGSRAALKGGYTTVNAMANTKPICSSMEIVNLVENRSKELDLIDIHQTVSITKNFDGKTLDHLETLKGRRFISDDGFGLQSSFTMYEALKKSKELDMLIMVHGEDSDISQTNYRVAEDLMTIRDLYLAKATESPIHFSHVSTKEAITAIRQGKKEGVQVTCEVTPHHIALWDNDFKVNPPIRSKEDTDAIIEGIKDGTVDAIATDHAPHTKDEKIKGAPGLVGFETSFPVVYTSLVKKDIVNLRDISRLMSYNPSKLMRINKGLIEVGYEGDLVLIDLENQIDIDENFFLSKGKNSPFIGKKYYGEVTMTIKKGVIKYYKSK